MPSNHAVELKGGLYTFMSLRLRTSDLEAVDAALADKVQQAPAFFRDTPVVVDLGELDPQTALDGAALLACIRRHRLLPIVASLADRASPLAEAIALPRVELGARRRAPAAERPAGEAPPADASPADGADVSRGRVPGGEAATARDGGPGDGPGGSSEHGTADGPAAGGRTAAHASGGTAPDSLAGLALSREVEYIVRSPMLIDRPVRSGQQIYARDTDLIIMGQVGPGAEVIADNNIHVYGPLRGRALCGVSGNADTRIFCQSLEAELVSVAGNYRMLETIPEELRGRPAQIWLDDDRLNIEPL